MHLLVAAQPLLLRRVEPVELSLDGIFIPLFDGLVSVLFPRRRVLLLLLRPLVLTELIRRVERLRLRRQCTHTKSKGG